VLQPVRMAVLALALSACASTPPPYQWEVYSNSDHIPMQGLPAVPRVIAHDRPLQLVNFANEAERDKARHAAIAAGAIAGSANVALGSLAALGPLCALLPPLCVGVVVAGGAGGAAASSVAEVPAQEAGQLGAIFEKHATNGALAQLASRQMPKVGERDYPQLEVRVIAVVLVPTHDGVSFRLAAEAQGFPDPDRAWRPSAHFVPFPSHTVADWLASDGRLLEKNLQAALGALSAHIVSVYLPYEERH
jgi:hypothetical protein